MSSPDLTLDLARVGHFSIDYTASRRTAPYPVVYLVPGIALCRASRHQLACKLLEEVLVGVVTAHHQPDASGISDHHATDPQQLQVQGNDLSRSIRGALQIRRSSSR